MSTLLVLTPLQAPAADMQPRGPAVDGQARGEGPWKWALSEDGRHISSAGEAPPALWPRADQLVLVVPPQALAWAVIDLPKVPPARLRAALDGALEETLLEEPTALHYALPAQARPGRRTPVAVMQRSPLVQALQAVQAVGREVDRVVPAFSPKETGTGTAAHKAAGPASRAPADTRASEPSGACTVHFQEAPGEGPEAIELVWADADGVAVLPLAGDGARALLQQVTQDTVHWSSTPAAASAAEAWAGRPLPVVHQAQPWLSAAGSGWELRQFDLAPRHRGLRWARDVWRQVAGPAWRPARLGLAALLALQVMGLQLWSWQQQQAVAAGQQAQVALLKATHPQVRVVLDAPLQMQREAERLRQAAGQPGEADLEAALSAAAAAWPAGLAPPQALRYERGELTLSVAGLSAAQGAELSARLQTLGWALESAGGRLTLTRRATPGRKSPTP